MMTSQTKIYDSELMCTPAASVTSSVCTDSIVSNTASPIGYFDNLVDTIWAKAKMQGRICVKNTIPLLWFKSYIKTSLPAIGNDTVRYDTFVKLISTGETQKLKRVSKDRAKKFFTTLQLKSDTEQNLEESLQVLEDSDEFSPLESSQMSEVCSDLGSSNSELHKSDENDHDLTPCGNAPSSPGTYRELRSGDFHASTPMKSSRLTHSSSESETPTPQEHFLRNTDSELRLIYDDEVSRLEADKASLNSQNTLYRIQIGTNKGLVDDLRQNLIDEREKNEKLIERYQQMQYQFKTKVQFLEGHVETVEQDRDRLRVDMEVKDETLAAQEKRSKVQIVDYEEQIAVLNERQTILCRENNEMAATVTELKIENMNLDAIMEESQEPLSPDKILARAVEDCKLSKSTASRLNKSENDLSWWRDHSAPKALKTVRKPVDFCGNAGGGENLADFIPQHKPCTNETSSQTPLAFRQRRPLTAKSLYLSIGVNVLLMLLMVYLALYYFREFFVDLGIVNVSYHEDFKSFI